MNSQLENTISKGDFVLKNRFETSVLKISGIQKKYITLFFVSIQFWYLKIALDVIHEKWPFQSQIFKKWTTKSYMFA